MNALNQADSAAAGENRVAAAVGEEILLTPRRIDVLRDDRTAGISLRVEINDTFAVRVPIGSELGTTLINALDPARQAATPCLDGLTPEETREFHALAKPVKDANDAKARDKRWSELYLKHEMARIRLREAGTSGALPPR